MQKLLVSLSYPKYKHENKTEGKTHHFLHLYKDSESCV